MDTANRLEYNNDCFDIEQKNLRRKVMKHHHNYRKNLQK